MPLFFVKAIDFALTPLGFGLLVAGCGLAVCVKKRIAGVSLVGAGLVVLWIVSTPWVGRALLDSLEKQFPARPVDSMSTSGAIVALGGGISPAVPPRRHPNLHEASDRLWHAARLYHAGVAPVVIVSGGQPPARVAPTAPAMETFMASLGVPPDSVLLESESTTTHENAVFTARLCAKRGINRVTLVTSASHMRRALGAFRATDLKVNPAPVGYRAVRKPFTVLSILPEATGLLDSSTAVHEYVGYLYYRWQGWIE